MSCFFFHYSTIPRPEQQEQVGAGAGAAGRGGAGVEQGRVDALDEEMEDEVEFL